MQVLTTCDYSHLPEIEYHRDELDDFLAALKRRGGGTLRRMHRGGLEAPVILFCECSAITDALPVIFDLDKGQYVAAEIMETHTAPWVKIEPIPFTQATQTRRPNLFLLFVDMLRDGSLYLR